MSEAIEAYLCALQRMVDNRSASGTDWTQGDEADAASECDDLWWAMTRQEQDEAESGWASARTSTASKQNARFVLPKPGDTR